MLNKIIRSIRARNDFALHCHSMSLFAPDEAMPRFQGPGSVTFGRDRQIHFTIYADSLGAYPSPDRAESGKLIPNDSIYRLSAIDENGAEWICDQVPDVRVQPNKGMDVALITGDLIGLHSSERMFPEGFSAELAESVLTLYVFDNVDIPLNTRTLTEERVDGEDLPTGGAKLNVAKLELGRYKFLFRRQDDLLEIRVKAPTLDPGLDKRAIEALQFVLARPIWWTILCQRSGDTTLTRIRSAPVHSAGETHLPPIQSIAFYDPTECVWSLYARYFEHILAHKEDSWHPLSRYLYSAVEAHAAGFDTYRLALGVAVEGILKTSFKTVFTPRKEYLTAVDGLEMHFDAWKSESNWDGASAFRERVLTYVKGLRQPRAVDRLRRLKELGVVTKDEFDAWKELRNKTAHADRPDGLLDQRGLDDVLKVTTLFHKLIFQAIGYSGKFTDYGTRGFPTQEFAPMDLSADSGGCPN